MAHTPAACLASPKTSPVSCVSPNFLPPSSSSPRLLAVRTATYWIGVCPVHSLFPVVKEIIDLLTTNLLKAALLQCKILCFKRVQNVTLVKVYILSISSKILEVPSLYAE